MQNSLLIRGKVSIGSAHVAALVFIQQNFRIFFLHCCSRFLPLCAHLTNETEMLKSVGKQLKFFKDYTA